MIHLALHDLVVGAEGALKLLRQSSSLLGLNRGFLRTSTHISMSSLLSPPRYPRALLTRTRSRFLLLMAGYEVCQEERGCQRDNMRGRARMTRVKRYLVLFFSWVSSVYVFDWEQHPFAREEEYYLFLRQ